MGPALVLGAIARWPMEYLRDRDAMYMRRMIIVVILYIRAASSFVSGSRRALYNTKTKHVRVKWMFQRSQTPGDALIPVLSGTLK